MSGGRARLAAVAVLVALAVVALVVGRPGRPGPVAATPDVVAASAAAAPDPAPAPSAAAASGRPGVTQDVPATEIELLAERAVTAWQTPDPAARAAALAEVATPAYQELAGTIDATRVPDAAVAGSALQVEADGQALVDVALDDDTVLSAVLVLEDGRWLLDDLRPGRTGSGA